MGMDVYGNTGGCFRSTIWHWRPLAKLVCRLAPTVTRQCKHWQSNDGDGLNDTNSRKLAKVLRRALADGTVADALATRDAKLAKMPDKACTTCHGTGIRSDSLGREQGQTSLLIEEAGHPRHGQRGWCNGCSGRGTVRPSETWYSLTMADVQEFADFLDICGGFQIC